MARVGIALGSNLGDRLRHLRAARDLLCALSPEPESLRQASVYQTAPVLCPNGAPDFLNTVIELEIETPPAELLYRTREIEHYLGRRADPVRNAPRVIDIDLLYAGNHGFESPELTLPHPRLVVRRFVLQPLADIRPELVLPGQTLAVSSLLANLPTDDELPRLFAVGW